jgi:Tfp pilus assembly protein PilF
MRTFFDRARARLTELLGPPPPPPVPPPPAPEPPRAQRILQWLWKQVSFKSLVLAAIIISSVAYLLWDGTRHYVVLDPIVVPKQFADAGLTSEVMTQRVREKLEEIQGTDESASSSRDQLSMQADRDVPDIEIPETKLSLRSLSDVLQKFLNNEPKHLSGEITSLASSGKMEIRSRVLRSGEPVQAAPPRELDTTDVDRITEMLARDLAELTDPYLLGMYLYNIKEFPAASDNNHIHAQSRLLQGYIALGQERRDEAVRDDQAAIQLDPKWAYSHNCLGLVLAARHEPDKAAVEFRKAIQLDWRFAVPHMNLGDALDDQHKLDEAVVEYRRAIWLNPKYAPPHNDLGDVLVEQHKLDEAAAEYRIAIQLEPKYASPHNGLGDVLDEQHKPDEAATEYRRAIHRDPKDASSHNNLGIVLKEQGKPDQAAIQFKAAHDLDPTRF